ncbi:MAG: spermine synthase, partial [Desulfuromonas sp.]
MRLSSFQQSLLYGIAFTNGALLMGMEILGSRILAPVLGNSIFVWGSLIGVFMGGMAVGYYVGGWLGDRFPLPSVLVSLLGFSALYLLLLPLWATPFSLFLADLEFDPRVSALLASLTLFYVPSLSMGAVSPFLFVLLFKGRQHAGRSVGALYAVSTVVSI